MDGAIFSLNNIFVNTNKSSFTAWQRFAMYEFGVGLLGRLVSQFDNLTPSQGLSLVSAHFNVNSAPSEKISVITEWQKFPNEEADGLSEKGQLPGIKRLLLNLYDHYVKIAVLDANGDVQNVLRQIDLDNYADSIAKTNDKESPYLTAANQLSLIGASRIGVGTTAHDIENIHHISAVAIGVGDAITLVNADYQVVQVGDLRHPTLQKIWEDKQ